MAIYVERSDGEYAIWSNPERGRSHSGRCIGTGRTLEEAKASAVDELLGDWTDIEALSDDLEEVDCDA